MAFLKDLIVRGSARIMGKIYADKFVGTATNTEKLNNIEHTGFSRSLKNAIDFGGNSNAISTAQFISLLKSKGAFMQPHWVARGSWLYANNQYINDTGCGYIHLAGATIEVFHNYGADAEYTIKISTATTSSVGDTKADFIYVNNGSEYSPGWRRLYSTNYHPIADAVKLNIVNEGDGSFHNLLFTSQDTSGKVYCAGSDANIYISPEGETELYIGKIFTDHVILKSEPLEHYRRLSPPFPLLYGHFTCNSWVSISVNEDVYDNYDIFSNYSKTYMNYSASPYYCGGNSAGGQLTGSPCVSGSPYCCGEYHVSFLFRIIGYDTNTNGNVRPFVEEVLLSSADMAVCMDSGYGTDAHRIVTPYNNEVHMYIRGFNVSNYGTVNGGLVLEIKSNSYVHFLEIALIA